MDFKVGKFYDNKNSLSVIHSPMKVHPVFVDDDKRIIERNLIIHSHETFSNEIDKRYNLSYMNNLGNMLYDNKKNYSKLRNALKLKKKNTRNLILSLSNENKINLDTLPLIKRNIEKKNNDEKKNKFLTPRNFSKTKQKINYKEIQKQIKLFKNDNNRLISYIISGEKYQSDYQKKMKLRIKQTLNNYSMKIKNIKSFKV